MITISLDEPLGSAMAFVRLLNHPEVEYVDSFKIPVICPDCLAKIRRTAKTIYDSLGVQALRSMAIGPQEDYNVVLDISALVVPLEELALFEKFLDSCFNEFGPERFSRKKAWEPVLQEKQEVY